jgi:hypothetical protein
VALSLGGALELADVVRQCVAIAGGCHVSLAAQVQPDAVIETVLGRVLPTRRDGRRRPPFHLAVALMSVEECTTVRGVLVNRAPVVEQPVAVAVGLAGGNEGRKRLVGHCPEMFLGPGEDVTAGRTEALEVTDVQAAGNVTARGSAEGARAPGSAEAILLARQLLVWSLV